MNYLSFDIGTTCCKCQLFSEEGEILEYLSAEYGFAEEDGEVCVDIAAIGKHVFSMLFEVAKKRRVDSVCFSSFGEAFTALDENDNILFAPMLYTDRRGAEEAAEISALFGDDFAFRTTGVIPDAMYSVSKLLWIKKHRPEAFAKIRKVMLIGDYLGYLLTGKRVIDHSLAARTGVYDIEALRFSGEMCGKLGIDVGWFSETAYAGTVVGDVLPSFGLKGCKLVLGSHDQVCTALGAGVIKEGQAVDGMGTVECITAVFRGSKTDPEMGAHGYCCVPFAIGGLYCSYIVNYACGSIVNWFRNNLLHNYTGDEKSVFAYLEKGMPDSTDLFFLPYFAGIAIPLRDPDAKGAVIGLTTSTTDSEIYRALMEALSMEMKYQTEFAERYGIKVTSAVATGGAANSEKWLRIKADVQNIPYAVLRSSEGGLCGLAMIQAVAMKGETFGSAAEKFVRYKGEFRPERPERYEKKYEKYIGIYDKIKELFR